MTLTRSITLAVALMGAGALAACSDNQNVNAATGALVGAAAGNQIGSGSGRTAATLLGAAAGAQVGASQPTN